MSAKILSALSKLSEDTNTSKVDIVSAYHSYLDSNKMESSDEAFEDFSKEFFESKVNSDGTISEVVEIDENKKKKLEERRQKDTEHRFINFDENVSYFIRNYVLTDEIDQYKKKKFKFEILTEKGEWIKQNHALSQALETRLINLLEIGVKGELIIKYTGMRKSNQTGKDYYSYYVECQEQSDIDLVVLNELAKLSKTPEKKTTSKKK